jgi:hypothetical protein
MIGPLIDLRAGAGTATLLPGRDAPGAEDRVNDLTPPFRMGRTSLLQPRSSVIGRKEWAGA